MQTEVLNVLGMTTEECTDAVVRAIKTIDGVANVSASYPQSRIIVQYDEEMTAMQEMRAVLAKAGYTVKNPEAKEQSCGGCCGSCGGSK